MTTILLTTLAVGLPVLLALWHVTARTLVAQACRLLLDPVEDLSRATLSWQATLARTLSGLSERHEWERPGVFPFSIIASIVMTSSAVVLLLTELELGLATYPVAFGMSPPKSLPLGLNGLKMDPGVASALACTMASLVLAIKFIELRYIRAASASRTISAMNWIVPVIAVTVLFGLYSAAAEFRFVQTDLQAAEDSQIEVLANQPLVGFRAGTATSSASVETTTTAIGTAPGRAARLMQLETRSSQLRRILNVGITTVVVLGFLTASHAALVTVPGLILWLLARCAQIGTWALQTVLRTLNQFLHAIATLGDWVIRTCCLLCLPVTMRLSGSAREHTDLYKAVETSTRTVPDTVQDVRTEDLVDEHSIENKVAVYGDEIDDSWAPESYDPFGTRPQGTPANSR